MKFTVSSSALLSLLATTGKVISNKSSLPILEYFLMELKNGQLTVTTSDLETTLVGSIAVDNVEQEGVIAAPAKLMLDSLKEFPEMPLVIEVNDTTWEIQITWASGHLSIPGASAVSYPATQSLGAESKSISLDVDMLAFSAHKFYGPKGAGVLYIKNGVKVEKLIGGGEQERGRRGGTLNVPAIVGLAKAYEITREEMDKANAHLAALSTAFLDGVAKIEGVTRNGQGGLPSVVNLRIDGVENTAFLFNMDLQGVCLAAGSACASASVKPSHVLTAMGLTETQAKECVRFSFGKNNTLAEVTACLERMEKLIAKLRA